MHGTQDTPKQQKKVNKMELQIRNFKCPHCGKLDHFNQTDYQNGYFTDFWCIHCNKEIRITVDICIDKVPEDNTTEYSNNRIAKITPDNLVTPNILKG